ncbi:MAG: hypothetical protein HOW97_27835 [Catenulispora sp.]|nr:hypothetical protein [Catenulispora sp.]
MATSGRGESVSGLLETAQRRRRARSVWFRIFLVIAGLIATAATVGTVSLSVSLLSAQSKQDAYDKAPLCAAGTDTHGCALQTTAKVTSDWASKNTGKNQHGYTTRALLEPTVGHWQTVTVSDSTDLTYYIHKGDTWSVLVWRDEITRFTYAGKTHNADKNPHVIVDVLLAVVPIALTAASVFGRMILRRLLRIRVAINPARHRIPDWTLVLLVLMTGTAAILHASRFVAVLGLLGITVLICSGAVWPFLPWVLQPDPGSLLGQGKTRAKAKPARRLP